MAFNIRMGLPEMEAGLLPLFRATSGSRLVNISYEAFYV
jgi:hypothetical protein